MLKTILKSTTAATLIAGLVPAWSLAQDAPLCAADAPTLPCVAPDGTLIERRRDLRGVLEAMGVENVGQVLSGLGGGDDAEAEAPPAAEAAAEAEPAAEPEQAAAPADAPEESQAAEAEPAAEPEQAAAPADAPEQAAEPAPDAEAAPAADAVETAEPAAPAEAAPQSAATEPATDAPAAAAEADPAQETVADDIPEVASETPAEQPAAEAQAAEAAASEAETVEEAIPEVASDAPPADAAAPAAEAQAQAEAAPDAAECSLAEPMVPCLRPNGSLIETRSDFRDFARNQGAEDVPAVMDQLRANLGLPPRQADGQASAAAADGGETADVVTDEVTADEVRTAEEEFDTAVTEEAAPEADADDEGLSNFQRALLLGLGAAAVGSFLSNGDQVVSNSGDRVVVDTDEGLRVLKNDDVLLRQPGSEVRTETFSDGSTRTFVSREDGSQVVTIRAADGSVLRRSVVLADGSEVQLFDDTGEVAPVEVSALPTVEEEARATLSNADEQAIRAALTARLSADVGRTFSLRQIRQYKQVRALAPEVALDNITFATGSAAIDQSAADELVDLGVAIESILRDDRSQVFLIEGHTDAVGDAGYNLALSDRRAETVALALTQFFDVPPENLITQGYGESDLLIETEADERLNRRASVRNISDLLR